MASPCCGCAPVLPRSWAAAVDGARASAAAPKSSSEPSDVRSTSAAPRAAPGFRGAICANCAINGCAAAVVGRRRMEPSSAATATAALLVGSAGRSRHGELPLATATEQCRRAGCSHAGDCVSALAVSILTGPGCLSLCQAGKTVQARYMWLGWSCKPLACCRIPAPFCE